ncbi:amidohydrolase family protein [Gordonia alkanivorans]|uniref:amidohydrolase family protein n=1 Tax=Gordonia alkanivorans TaxID=84096 RepID=UPI0024B87170|nr:amidohydrolase family protein [Gordonia alkanivorans]MDJ0098397.1 amidohydrolase family protein [Gordonia alkanivorans]
MRPTGDTATVVVDAMVTGLGSAPIGLTGSDGGWAIGIEDGRVVSIDTVPARPGRCDVALPTLANAHDHGRGDGTQLLGARDARLDPWIADFLALTPGDSQYDNVFGSSERMRDAGVGSVNICLNPTTDDLAHEVREAARAVRAVGVRACIGVPLTSLSAGAMREGRGRNARARAHAERELDRIDELAAEIEGPDLALVYHPVGPQWVDEDALAACADRSAATGRVMHMHLLETEAQRQWADRTYPDGIVRALDDLGFLTAQTVLAHGVHLRPDEMELIARRGSTVVVNAASNFRLASGIPDVDAMTTAGVRVAIGMDGMTLEDDADMWRELRLVRGLWQGLRRDTVGAREVLGPATVGAAASFGAAAPEPLQVGALADFVVHDLTRWAEVIRHPRWGSAEVALSGARGSTVREMWCRGVQLVDKGRRRGD